MKKLIAKLKTIDIKAIFKRDRTKLEARRVQRLRRRVALRNRFPRVFSSYKRFKEILPLNSLVIAIVLELIIESLGHKSPVGGVIFAFAHFVPFVVNVLIIYSTLTIAWLLKRRVFVNSLIILLWLALGVTNGAILIFRMTPFTTADLNYIGMALDILPNYMNSFQITMIAAGVIAIVLIFISMWIWAPKVKRVNYKKNLVLMVVSILIAVGAYNGAIGIGQLDKKFPNLWDAYYKNGVPYCFLSTWLNKGIRKPLGYDKEMIEKVVPKKALDKQHVGKDKPNIIFLQLESFMDPEEMENITISRPATPYFKELMQNYSSGYLDVSVFGGGTANTEFEVMTGMDLSFFGPGEYPYKTILSKKTVETVAYDLKAKGYATHAMHNHRGAFYGRNKVFANMGFDDFTSLEYMTNVDKTPRNWARDEILTGEILEAMKRTPERDYTYCISVQGHGEYPASKLIDDPQVTVKSEGMEQEELNKYEYYVNQMKEMDDFLRDLIVELEALDEPTVLVAYGDHLPAIDLKDEDMKAGTIYKTQYVIWDNFGLEKRDENVPTYRLTQATQARIGMLLGTTTVFHTNNFGKKDYLADLKALQYDLLYGKRYAYYDDGKNPYKPVAMKMGYKPIRIEDLVNVGSTYYIVGEGFTPFSKISLNGKLLDTIFLSSTTLKLEDKVSPSDLKNLKISQVEKNKAILSTTE